MACEADFTDAGIASVHRIGDAIAPGALVHAVYSGHLHARLLDEVSDPGYLRDIPIGVVPPGPAYPG
jgi:dimethylamine/trimethylamine dehydrogenase